jgi:hypothetical protein
MIEPAAVCVAGRASAGPWLFYMAPMHDVAPRAVTIAVATSLTRLLPQNGVMALLNNWLIISKELAQKLNDFLIRTFGE